MYHIILENSVHGELITFTNRIKQIINNHSSVRCSTYYKTDEAIECWILRNARRKLTAIVFYLRAFL